MPPKISQLLANWRLAVVILTPMVFALLPILIPTSQSRCGYVIIVMAVYWMTEALPLAVTALIPVFAFPLLGVLSTAAVSINYMKETNMMFLGGLTVAIAVEHCNLHKRISLFVILKVGQSPRRLMAGFMITTMFLSMWISNTATTAMMVPILEAVLQEIDNQTLPEETVIEKRLGESINDLSSVNHRSQQDLVVSGHNKAAEVLQHGPDGSPSSITTHRRTPNSQALRDMYFLATAYASNIGGTGSLTGTGPNVVVKGFLEKSFSEPTGLNFGSWMAFNIPGMLICVFLAWVWLQILFIYFKGATVTTSPEQEAKVRKLIQQKYDALGRMTDHEIVVLTLFVTLILLWLFRSPEIIPGWGDLFKYFFGDDFVVKDATPAIFVSFLLFIIPKDFSSDGPARNGIALPRERCITWEIVEKRIPWGVLLLLGGGFAMAEASEVSYLSKSLGQQLTVLGDLHPAVIVLLISIMTACATEVASNTATASIIIPILLQLSLNINVNPLYLILPAALSCSYAFMLPVATPPNAIVFEAAKMRTLDMMLAGIVMNVVCVLVMNVMINTYGILIFDVMNQPSWINSTINSIINSTDSI